MRKLRLRKFKVHQTSILNLSAHRDCFLTLGLERHLSLKRYKKEVNVKGVLLKSSPRNLR